MLADEQHIIKLARSGDQVAFGKLVSEYKDYVFSLAFKMLKHRQDAEEVSQHVFVKVFKSLESYNHDSKFSTWLYTITYRSGIDFIRTKKKKVSIEGTEGLENRLEDSSGGNLTEKKDLKSILKLCIDKLETTESSIISMFYLQELSVKEIAEVTELSVSNVKVKLFRGRKTLSHEIRLYLGDEISLFL